MVKSNRRAAIKQARIAFTRVPHGRHTIGVDTAHINRDGDTFFETAARLDPSPFTETCPWHIFVRYVGRAQALAGHRRWAQKIREHGLPGTAEISDG
jgi:hypothetical protein